MNRTILILLGPEYEDLEVWYPKLRLEEAGYEVKLAGLGDASEYRGKHGYPCKVDGRVADFPAAQLAGILAPGGWAPDKIRRDPEALRRVREILADVDLFRQHGHQDRVHGSVRAGNAIPFDVRNGHNHFRIAC